MKLKSINKKRYNTWIKKLKREIGDTSLKRVLSRSVQTLNLELEQIGSCEKSRKDDLSIEKVVNPELFDFTDKKINISIKGLKAKSAFKKKNIHSKEWQWMAIINSNNFEDLIFNKSELEKAISDRMIIDSFGNHIEVSDVFNAARILSSEKYETFLLILPPIHNLVNDISIRLRNIYLRYFSDHDKSLLPNSLYNSSEVVLFFMDSEDVLTIKNKKRYTYQFSHSKHVMQHAHNFIENGYDVLINQHGSGKYHLVDQVFPTTNIINTWSSWVQDSNNQKLPFKISGVFSIYGQDFQHGIPGVNIWLQPAVHWIENAQFFPLDYGATLSVNAPLIDMVISQNDRMIELTRSLIELNGSRIEEESYLLGKTVHEPVKSSIKKRNSLRAKLKLNNKKVIVNGGGAWDWTATVEFMETLITYFKKNPSSNIVFIQCGIRQKSNNDHQKSYDGITKLKKKYPMLFGKYGKIRILEWNEASDLLPDLLYACDYGFGCSKVSVEAFQAHRVRNSEYLSYGLPVIMNEFDVMSDYLSKGGAIKIDNKLNFLPTLKSIEKEDSATYKKRKADLKKYYELISQEILEERNQIIKIFEKKKGSVARANNIYTAARDMQAPASKEILYRKLYDHDGNLLSMNQVSLETKPADDIKIQSEKYKTSSGFYPVPSNIKETMLLIIRLFAKLILKILPNFISNPIRRIFSGWYRKRFVSMSEK